MRKVLLTLAEMLESCAAHLRKRALAAKMPGARTASFANADEEESEMMATDPHLCDLVAIAFEKKEELA